jgi:hypothetical protein
MPDLGSPSSYLLLQPGVPVYGSDGVPAGTVKEVMAAPDKDIFDGILVATDDGDRFVVGADVKEIFEQGVELSVRAVVVSAQPKLA